MSHTKGPWVVRNVDSNQYEIDAPNGDQRANIGSWSGLAIVYGQDGSEIGPLIAMSNASLIAAAPDLLAACERTVELFDKCENPEVRDEPLAINGLRAAIARAKGEA